MSDEEVRASLVRLTELLTERTDRGEIEWKAAARRENEFSTSGPHSAVKVWSWLDSDQDMNYMLALLNPRGQVVAELVSMWNQDNLSGPAPWNAQLRRLHEVARRRALNVDELLSETFNDLMSGNFREDAPPF